jgi:WG containing repeat
LGEEPFFPYTSPDETAFVRRQLKGCLERAGFGSVSITPFDWLYPSTPESLIPAVSFMGKAAEAIWPVREFAGSLSLELGPAVIQQLELSHNPERPPGRLPLIRHYVKLRRTPHVAARSPTPVLGEVKLKRDWPLSSSGDYKTGKRGFVDKQGKFVINPQFDEGHAFSGGFAVVRVGDEWGFITIAR